MLDKKCGPPKPLRTKNYIYDLVEDTNTIREPDLKLILTSYVDGSLNYLKIVSLQ